MAVIKSLNLTTGCYIDGRQSPEMSVEDAISIIKRTEDRSDILGQRYVGENGVLDIDVSKIRCDNCRMNFEGELGIDRRL